MPTTPNVRVNIKNENIEVAVPQNGISHVVARTTKGPFNDPSKILSSYTQFQRLFGEEIVPDGSISNIKKAFELGSKLRVSRVAGGASTPAYGTVNTKVDNNETIEVRDPDGLVGYINLTFKTKEQGTKLFGYYDSVKIGYDSSFSGGITTVSIVIMDPNSMITLASYPVFKYDNYASRIDAQGLLTLNNDDELPLFISGAKYGSTSMTEMSVPELVELLNNPDVIPGGSYVDIVSGTWPLTLSKGSDGGDATVDTWKAAAQALMDYVDGYNLVLSHIHQHNPSDYTSVYSAVATIVKKAQEIKLMVELPKPTSGTTLSTYLTSLITLVQTVGQDPFICYHGGGIKYYNELGTIVDCDVLGTVLGLSDTCASEYGPWKSPAGMNRGLVPSSPGPVIPNLGTPSMLETLQGFADWYMNLFVIKKTPTAGMKTMLWHNFSSSPIQDSFRFLSTVNLVLYLKKNIRPILEAKIEEPNIWDTWKDIYYQVKPILDDLVNNNALTDPRWYGDQDVQRWEDLQINNEADCRQGKYKAILIFKDVVTLQEIELNIVVDKASASVSVEVTE